MRGVQVTKARSHTDDMNTTVPTRLSQLSISFNPSIDSRVVTLQTQEWELLQIG